MANGSKQLKKYVYVFLLEHYHFPTKPTDMNGDMVGCTPVKVHAGTDTGRISLKEYAREQANRVAESYNITTPGQGEVKSFDSGSEYRVWIDWKADSLGYANADRFVWVVRRVEYSAG